MNGTYKLRAELRPDNTGCPVTPVVLRDDGAVVVAQLNLRYGCRCCIRDVDRGILYFQNVTVHARVRVKVIYLTPRRRVSLLYT